MTTERTESADGEFTVQFKQPIKVPTVTYNLRCKKCQRPITVTAAVNGSNHNIGVWVQCVDCGPLAPSS